METKTKQTRLVALEILEHIFSEGAYSNIALDKQLRKDQLSSKNKALVTEIVYGTVARKLTLEWYLSHYIANREELEKKVYTLLMLSLYQLLYLDKIPHYAIVNEAVNLAKNIISLKSSKLVNAVLRRILREGLPDLSSIKRKNKRLSITYSTPVWLVKKLIDEYGKERAELILASLFVRSKASVRVTHLEEKNNIKTALGLKESLIADTALVSETGHFSASHYFQEGRITIQDESSQLVAQTLDITGDESILDACSAPGGKTSHMASYLTTGHITALDLYDHKLALVRANADRLHVADKITTKKLDATKVHHVFPQDSFDKALVDAPCSGIGLIRRKPDIKYNKNNQDFERLAKVQLEILNSVCQTIRKGGIITYSTCTIFGTENHQVIKQFLKEHPHFTQVKLTHPCQELVEDGCITITPEQYGCDGFFIAQLKRMA
ncbi:16S rRNA (cytosine(967)-C(5))-methyltransferase RsmB [Streptococcus sciuri]|uniref:16S rRNA (cytosine(967)-C(5))-methyltransferase n=1 Tax=Streptococcus sciuri TaxID=2973939 RepID=A0ABT2F849_9STRE|nr:16S rRNA (cytosine(967)-C(5))-methyltransferase RsmB [Streptococcus sciuri]MCS4488594.1 16S rRNA (cytosine(967)-C(5))-methyltransferase RsmB [Streptococcus sciuri]